MDQKYMYNKVMLIDDDVVDCQVNEKILIKNNFAREVVIRYSFDSAFKYLEFLKSTPAKLPELIFLDLIMPGKDGFYFLKCFSQQDKVIHDHCSIVVLTASDDYLEFQRSLSSPFVISYLKKPLCIEELMQIKATG